MTTAKTLTQSFVTDGKIESTPSIWGFVGVTQLLRCCCACVVSFLLFLCCCLRLGRRVPKTHDRISMDRWIDGSPQQQDSTLTLPPGSKSDLLGFFTPAPCRPPPRTGYSEFSGESAEDGEHQQNQQHQQQAHSYQERYSSSLEAGGLGAAAVPAQL